MCDRCQDRFYRLTAIHLRLRPKPNDRQECIAQKYAEHWRIEDYKKFWGLDGFTAQEVVKRTDEKSYLETFTDEIFVKDSQP